MSFRKAEAVEGTIENKKKVKQFLTGLYRL
jgi:hypothetical protein